MNKSEFEKKVLSTIKDYKLLTKKDKIIVAASGGKDSTTVIYLLKKLGYNIEAITIDLLIGDWSKKNLQNTIQFCKDQNVKLHTVNIREEFGSSMCYIRSKIQSKMKISNCMICGTIKRWLLNKKSRELGATKIATGHNLDDEAETILMNLFKGNPTLCLGMGPKTGIIQNKKFTQRIKPLFFLSNKQIREYSKSMNFPVIYNPCPCLIDTSRKRIRDWINDLETKNPTLKQNLVINFHKILTKYKKLKPEFHPTPTELQFCTSCGEPSRGKICKMCQIVGILNS